MELTKKTTILFPPEFHEYLTRIARQRGVSLGWLVREACETRYGRVGRDARIEAVDALVRLDLPVGTPREMKEESVPDPAELAS